MEDKLALKLLPVIMQVKNKVDIAVKGHSMCPTLHGGDIIQIGRSDEYEVGEVLVFGYKGDELLVHRLIKKGIRYYCKGDNAFRLEDVEKRNIIGKVISVNGTLLERWPEWKIEMSYEVNRAFLKSGYDVQKTRQTDIYKVYETIVLKRND